MSNRFDPSAPTRDAETLVRAIEDRLARCGPALPYRRSKPWVLIGTGLSHESLRANTEVDIPVYGSAAELPLSDHSLDAIVSLYPSIISGGQTRRKTESCVARGFAEFGRERPFVNVAAAHFGPSAMSRRVRFHVPALTLIAPVFACHALKIPRCLFPFQVHLYHWTV